MFPERRAHKASCIWKTLLEAELGCEGCRDISEKEQGEEEVTRTPCSTVKERSVQPLCLEGARTYRLENWKK